MPVLYKLPYTNLEGYEMIVEILDTGGTVEPLEYVVRAPEQTHGIAHSIQWNSFSGTQFTPSGGDTSVTFNGTDSTLVVTVSAIFTDGLTHTMQLRKNGVSIHDHVFVADGTPFSFSVGDVIDNGDVIDVHIGDGADLQYADMRLTTTERVREVTLQGSGSPFKIDTVDNDENKFTPIRGKRATITFLSTNDVNLNSFSGGGGDDRYQVHAYFNDPYYPVFKGFLVLDDLQGDFLDDFTNQEIILTATDGLGLLKDIPLTKSTGRVPKGKYSIAEIVAMCLKKTGMNLPINVMNNLMEEHHQQEPAWNNVYLDGKSFEDEINTRINCYEVLEHILGEECFLFQWKCEWWVRRVDEFGFTDNYWDIYTPDGVYSATYSNASSIFDREIGKGLLHELVRPAALVKLTRPHAFVKELYRYEYPREILDNIDFSRGEENTSLSYPPFVVGGVTYYQTYFKIEDWQSLMEFAGNHSDTDAYIKRVYNDAAKTYEIERYVVIAAGPGGYYYIQSNPIPIGLKDKFTISVDARYDSDFGSTSGHYQFITIQVRLYGEDGTFWTLHGGLASDPEPRWEPTNSGFNSNNQYLWQEGDLTQDLSEFASISAESAPAPVAGEIVVQLIHNEQSDTVSRYFNNLNFTYSPYINGSYQKYTGQTSKVSQPGVYRAKRDETVYMSDSPKALFKGAMFTRAYFPIVIHEAQFIATGGKYFIAITSLFPGTFSIGKQYRVSGTTLNTNHVFRVIDIQYTGSTVLEVEEEVFPELAPAAVFEATSYSLAGRWYNGADPAIRATLPVDEANLHPLGYLQAYTVWNQYDRVNRIFDCHILGIHGYEPPDLIHAFHITDQSPHTDHRTFLLLHYTIDFYRCTFDGFLAEIYNTDYGKDYTKPFEFKYIENRS